MELLSLHAQRERKSGMKIHSLMAAAFVSVVSHAAYAEDAVSGTGSQAQEQSVAPATAQLFRITGARESAPRQYVWTDLGSPGSPNSVDKIVHLDSDAKFANVQYGTSVEFVQDGAADTQRAFVWRFDGWPRNEFDLNKVAPAGFFDHRVPVYISPDPSTHGG
jgi:hypothetical protein